MKHSIFFFVFFMNANALYSLQIFHKLYDSKQSQEWVWTKEDTKEFDELIVSWNAPRPKRGHYLLSLSVFSNESWSPWLQYALWGTNSQKTFSMEDPSHCVRTFQDTLDMLHGRTARGFRVRVQAFDGAHLDQWRALHACTSLEKDRNKDITLSRERMVHLPVEHLSQMAVDHPRRHHLCSATATSALLRFLRADQGVFPDIFAEQIFDSGFDIYGNWIFCTAQAALELPSWFSWVARIKSFDEVIAQLEKSIPVVMSIKGPLEGAHSAHQSGHLITIVGYNPSSKKVLCMDPAFPQETKGPIGYDLHHFLQATKRRGHVAYFFSPYIPKKLETQVV